MKLHELDWSEVLGALPRWEALSPGARRAFIGITPGHPIPLQTLGAAGAELNDAGLLVAPAGPGTHPGPEPSLLPLLVALRAADRLRPLAGVEGRLGQGYVLDQLNTMQSHRIAGPDRGYFTSHDAKLAAGAASSAGWVRGFLAAEPHRKMMKWEGERLPSGERPRLVSLAVARALRALVQALAPHPRGVPLRSVAALVPDAKPDALAAALAAGLRYLLVFVSVTRNTDAVVGLLPAVAGRLAGTVPPPGPVEARVTFAAPFRIGDMTAVMVEAATEPIAIRAADRSLYVRARRAIAARLSSVPGWVARLASTGTPGDEIGGPDDAYDALADAAGGDEAAARRVELAVYFASMLRLAAVKHSGSRPRLEATRTGRAWLASGEGERLRQVLAALRTLQQRNLTPYGGSGELEFFGAPLGFEVEARGLDARAALTAAFRSTPPGALVPVAQFARYHAREHNPFLGPDGPVLARSVWSGEPISEEGWEETWAGVLLTFLERRLVPLGCATLGRLDDGTVAFGLTDAGRYLLGERDDFELAPEPGGGEVVVQPDFEIVFLAPAPRAEAELGRIAERTGSGVGALFRLTRASVLRAAEQGMSGAQVLQTLESASRGGVPANVARQVRDWVNAARTIRIEPAVLVHCPDAETAARVRTLGGAHVTEITRTVLSLQADAKTRAALVKRLRDKGIFVASGTTGGADARAPAGRPARAVSAARGAAL